MDLNANGSGIFPSQMLAKAVDSGWISSLGSEIPYQNIQPASLDLRLGDVAYRLRCSFLPGDETVEEALRRYEMGKINLRTDKDGILEHHRPYLIPLVERLALPKDVRGKANPKSSTGRLDIFTRVITDYGYAFDEIPVGYQGPLYLEIVPRTFAIRVSQGLTLNQLRLMIGDATLNDDELYALHAATPILFRNGKPLKLDQISVGNGLSLGLNLGRDRGREVVGFRAKDNSDLIDLSKQGYYPIYRYWDEVFSERSDHGARIVLDPEKFYLLLSQDHIRIPPAYAAEMIAYDPASGELRTHYAGFFDPGFGFFCGSEIEGSPGSRAALEVRAHDVPFAVEHGQNICKLSLVKMIEPPEKLYGQQLRSNYQRQEIALSKHFRRERSPQPAQATLFSD